MIAEYPGLKAPTDDCVVIDYDKLVSLEEFKSLADDASVIWAVDFPTGKTGIVYGSTFLRTILQGVIPPQAAKVVAFAIDFSTDQLEHLIAATQVTKGCHEWNLDTTDGRAR